MKCDRCKNGPREVGLTFGINGNAREVMVCWACYEFLYSYIAFAFVPSDNEVTQ